MVRSLVRWIVFSAVLGAIVLACRAGGAIAGCGPTSPPCSACALYAVLSVTPDLAQERFRPPSRGADATALIFIRLLGFGHLVVGALDAGRWHLLRPVPTAVRAVALPLMVVAVLFIFRAMRENRFFSAVVRIQDDRGHHVIDSGPYALVRHPGYAGMIGGDPGQRPRARIVDRRSRWRPTYSALIARRVTFEDRFLQRDLPGYADYTQRVRYRLIPGVW